MHFPFENLLLCPQMGRPTDGPPKGIILNYLLFIHNKCCRQSRLSWCWPIGPISRAPLRAKTPGGDFSTYTNLVITPMGIVPLFLVMLQPVCGHSTLFIWKHCTQKASISLGDGGFFSSCTHVITPVGILYNGESPYSESCCGPACGHSTLFMAGLWILLILAALLMLRHCWLSFEFLTNQPQVSAFSKSLSVPSVLVLKTEENQVECIQVPGYAGKSSLLWGM